MTPDPHADLHDRLDELERARAAAAAAGDDAREAALLQELAVVLTALEETPTALAHVERARALHAAAGRTLEEAKAVYALGFLVARRGGDEARGRALLGEALAAFEGLGEAGLAGRTRGHLAVLALRAHDWPAADAHFGAAAEALAAAGERERVLEALQLRAFALRVQARPHDAFRVLAGALELARRHGSAADVLRVRLDLHHLAASPLVSAELQPEPLDALIRDAEAAAEPGLAGMARLAAAAEHAEAGRLDAARKVADEARRGALEALDPLLYLLACLQIAAIEERRGDRVALLTILFTCQASLGDLLGDEARVPVLLVLDSLEHTWGEAAFAAALASYRARLG